MRAFDNRPSCGRYALVARPLAPIEPDRYEPDDNRSQAEDVAIGGPPQDRNFHSPGDRDHAQLALSANQRVRIHTTGECDTLLTLSDARGDTVAFDDDSGEGLNALIEFTAPQAGGRYYVEVREVGDLVCEAYQLHLVGLRPIEASGLVLNGERHPTRPLEDETWFEFRLDADDVVVLMASSPRGQPCELRLSLVDAANTSLQTRSSGRLGGDVFITYRVDAGGQYRARVESTRPCAAYELRGTRFPATATPPSVPLPSPTATARGATTPVPRPSQ